MIASRAWMVWPWIVIAAACGQPHGAPPAAPVAARAAPVAASVAPPPAPVVLDDGTVHGTSCPPGSREAVTACLAEYGFCGRDADPLAPALPDLVVIQTHGAMDCDGNYLIVAAGGQWTVLADIYDHQHHNPQFGDFALTGVRDDHVAGRRVTRIDYTVDVYAYRAGSDGLQRRALACTWPAAGLPSCADAATP